MKKYLIILLAAISFIFVACDAETETESGGTAVEKMAGDWWVTYQQSVDEYYYIFKAQGTMPTVSDIENWNWDYVYDDKHSKIYTYNTAANLSTEMYISDDGNYKDYKIKATVDYDARTFTCPQTANLASTAGDIDIIGGKILEGAATTPSGMPADSIVFYIKLSNDQYGFTYTKVSGFRRTGFKQDDF